MVADSIPPKTLWDESINQSSLCTHVFHCADPDIHVLDW